MTDIFDRSTTRWWEIDLETVRPHRAYVPTPPPPPYKQNIVHFDCRSGSVERFGIRQTVPAVQGDDGTPPTQAQYGAVTHYFLDACETRLEAGLMLSARDYADLMARDLRFTAARRQFVGRVCAAFILADVETRLRVRGLNARKRGSDLVPRDLPKTYDMLDDFVGRMIADVRFAGSQLFG